ncbi:MAG: hypothetical protein R2761_03435 [Acidimicrobiales bacterium]
MAGPLVALLVGVGMVVGVVGGGRRAEPAPVALPLRAEARRVVRWSWGGLALGLAAAVALSRWDRLGRGLLLAAPVLGLAVLAGTLGGELAVTGPTGGTRRAGLRARRVGDYLPRRPSALVVLAIVALVATAVGAILAGSDDDLGRAGRALTTSCSPDTSSSRGPWPGWFYSGPLLAVVAVGLALAAVALRTVVNRPRLTVAPVAVPVSEDAEGGDAEALALDDALRRWSARRVVAAVAMLVALPLLGTASVAAVALAGADCLPAGGQVAVAALGLVAPLAAVLLGWSAQSLLMPAGLRAGSGAERPA